MGVKSNLKLIFSYLKLNIKKEWQYKASFIMQIVTMLLNDLFFIIQWLIIFSLVDNIGGYGFRETMLLWSIGAGAYGFSHLFFGGAWKIKDYVYDGKMDVYFTQPKNLLINVCCSQTNISALGDLLYTFVILIIIKAPWWWFLAMIPVLTFSGMIYASVYVFYVSLCFHVKGGESLARMVESTTTKVQNYPPAIFSNGVKFIMSTLIPVVFYSFMPVEYIFLSFNPLYLLVYLGVTVLWVSIAFLVFKLGIKKYNSGSVMGGRL
ncbi:MAG: ABC-2 family transporter protein [Clostridia bacterium]|nr:ABC-2 family transporter protein [Clostridia bacterium]